MADIQKALPQLHDQLKQHAQNPTEAYNSFLNTEFNDISNASNNKPKEKKGKETKEAATAKENSLDIIAKCDVVIHRLRTSINPNLPKLAERFYALKFYHCYQLHNNTYKLELNEITLERLIKDINFEKSKSSKNKTGLIFLALITKILNNEYLLSLVIKEIEIQHCNLDDIPHGLNLDLLSLLPDLFDKLNNNFTEEFKREAATKITTIEHFKRNFAPGEEKAIKDKFTRGLTSFKQHNFDQSINDFKAVIEHQTYNNETAHAYLYLGMIYASRDELTEAKNYFTEGQKVNSISGQFCEFQLTKLSQDRPAAERAESKQSEQKNAGAEKPTYTFSSPHVKIQQLCLDAMKGEVKPNVFLEALDKCDSHEVLPFYLRNAFIEWVLSGKVLSSSTKLVKYFRDMGMEHPDPDFKKALSLQNGASKPSSGGTFSGDAAQESGETFSADVAQENGDIPLQEIPSKIALDYRG